MVEQRMFDVEHDYENISGLLRRCYQPLNRDGNWFQPMWDHTFFHPAKESDAFFEKLGIWTDQGELVAATVCDLKLNSLSLCTLEGHKSLRAEMLAYAQEHLSESGLGGNLSLSVYAHDADHLLEDLLAQEGYQRQPEGDRVMPSCPAPQGDQQIDLPDDYSYVDLESDNDVAKIDRVLWRGFDHEG